MSVEEIWKFCEEQCNGNFNVQNIPADACSRQASWKFFKDVRKKDDGVIFIIDFVIFWLLLCDPCPWREWQGSHNNSQKTDYIDEFTPKNTGIHQR